MHHRSLTVFLLCVSIEEITKLNTVEVTVAADSPLVSKYGTKPAALIEFIRTNMIKGTSILSFVWGLCYGMVDGVI